MKFLKKILTLILIQALVRAGPPKDDCCKQQNCSEKKSSWEGNPMSPDKWPKQEQSNSSHGL